MDWEDGRGRMGGWHEERLDDHSLDSSLNLKKRRLGRCMPDITRNVGNEAYETLLLLLPD